MRPQGITQITQQLLVLFYGYGLTVYGKGCHCDPSAR